MYVYLEWGIGDVAIIWQWYTGSDNLDWCGLGKAYGVVHSGGDRLCYWAKRWRFWCRQSGDGWWDGNGVTGGVEGEWKCARMLAAGIVLGFVLLENSKTAK